MMARGCRTTAAAVRDPVPPPTQDEYRSLFDQAADAIFLLNLDGSYREFNDAACRIFGYSRDDAGVFLGEYVDKGILPTDPFQSLDRSGVGQLVQIGTERGRKTRKALKVGICGEHGGDPDSVHFCHGVGMNYVSCSPFRVPIARLSAAQAALSDGQVERDK